MADTSIPRPLAVKAPQAARLLGVSRATVGRIGPRPLRLTGKTIVYVVAELEDWLRGEAEAGRVPALPADRTMLFNPEAVEQALAQRAQQPCTEGADAR